MSKTICFYPNVSTLETFGENFCTEFSDKKFSQKFLL